MLFFFLMFFKKFCINKQKLLQRDELVPISFTSNKISIKNRTSFICPYYLKNVLFSYGRKLLRCSYLFPNFHEYGFSGTMKKVYRTINESVNIYNKLYIPILLTLCNNVSMKNVIRRDKSLVIYN